MAGWNFRKRKNILPGVTLNFSKNGISTSVGPKGARLSFGKNGTYLNTSIPGTGLYKRQKIGRKTDSNIETSGSKGCLRTIVWLVLLLSVISFFGGILTINESKNQVETQTEINEEPKTGVISDEIASIFTLIFLAAVSICCIVILVKIKSSSWTKANNGARHKENEQFRIGVENTLDSFRKDVANGNLSSSIKKYDLELKGYDPLFEDAARVIVINQQGSTSLIQRKFSIGFSRAGRIMDQLEQAGITGPYTGGKEREVFISNESELDELLEKLSKKEPKQNSFSDNSINDSHFVSQQLFDDYCVVVKRVNDMAKWMKGDDKFKSILSEQHITFKGETLKDEIDLVNVLIEIDFLKCVLKLGKQLDLKHNDCFGLLLLNMALENDTNITYDNTGFVIEKLSGAVQGIYEMLKSSIEKNAEVEGGFMISYILGEVDKKKQSSYLICLHRFSTIIAGIDNEITDEEQKGIDYVSEKLNSVDLSDSDEGSKFNTENEKTKENAKTKSNLRSHKAANELQKLIGLQSVKSEVETLTNFIKIQQSRAEKGLKATSVSYHCVFTGNPGTGKTTVARIVANIYKELGVLKKGHLVETDRSGLVAEYVGQTAVKTNKVIDSALDGVLFIDEAYSLVGGGQNDFGIEAISTLLKRMEDDRDRLVVILAGYSNEMQTFINANPGLQSRFNRYIEFPDYSADELAQIFEFNLTKNEYTITDDAKTALTAYLNNVVATKDERFGNARFVRNLFEKTIERQANRLAQEKQLTAVMLTTIELADLAV